MHIVLLIALLITAPAFAEDEPTKSAQVDLVEERETPPLRNKIYKVIAKAQNEISRNKLDKAEKRLRKLIDKNDLNGYEIGNVYNTLAFIQYKKDDYQSALELYELVIEQSPQIPFRLEQMTHYTSGQLALLVKNYARSKHHFESYVAMTTEHDPRVDRMLSEVYLGLERFDEGEVFLMRYLEHLYESGKEPNERLLEIMAEYETR